MTAEQFQKVDGLHLIEKDGGVFIQGITNEQVMAVFKQASDSIYRRQIEVSELDRLCDLITRSVNGTEMLQVSTQQWKFHCTELKNFMADHGCEINLRPIE